MIIGVDGKHEHPLGSSVEAGEPAWSPDGTSIVVNNDVQLTVFRPDGTPIRQMAVPPQTFASSPAWSHDGTWISFTATTSGSTREYTSDIYKVHPDGSELTRVTDNHDLTAGAAWSPDGTRLVISRSTQTDGGASHTTPQLWTMNTEGGDLRQLTNTSGAAGQAAWA
jgi:Tol biopolymer transport system component